MEKTVADVMTRDVRSLKSSDTLAVLINAMRQSPQDIFPVIDEKGRVSGTISEIELLKMLEPNQPTLSFGPSKLIREGLVRDLEDIMAGRPSSVLLDEPLQAALKRMATMRIPQLVVVDEKNHLVGLLRGRDVFLAMIQEDDA